MKASLLCTVALALLVAAGSAHAAANPFGLNLAWTDCYGDGGTSNRLFACNTNVGNERVNMSFKLDQPLTNVTGMEMYLQIASESPTLPLWWSLMNTGTCRPSSLALVTQANPNWTQCQDWGAGTFGSSGIGNYVIGAAGPNTVTSVAVSAVPSGLGIVLASGVEYFNGAYSINHQKTVGAGACGGCIVPVCILFSKLKIYTENPAGFRWITTSANTPNSRAVTWQSAQFVNLVHNCDASGFCITSFACGTPPVSAQPNTWSAVKSLYR